MEELTRAEQLERYRQHHRIQLVRRNREDFCGHDGLPLTSTTHRWVHDPEVVKALAAEFDGAGFPQKGR